MSNKELERKSEIEKALDKRITQKEGAEKLGISERQMRRLIQLFKKGGTAGIVSKKRGVPSNRKIAEEVENKAMCVHIQTDTERLWSNPDGRKA